MKFHQLVIKPLKETPAGADTINHQLLVQGGFVRQLMAGVYIYLPLGRKVLDKIREIVREEMDGIGGKEIYMPALHPSANWKKTGGWDNIDVLFKIKSRTGKDYALGQSHEEVVTPLAKEMIKSYKDLPLAVYQIQWKYRDELRAKSGILRGKEFEMKDMYSFHDTEEDFEQFYEQAKKAYLRIFKRLGLTAKVTEASGGSFTDKISFEFMVLTDAGEDDILYCPKCDFCINTEIATQKENDNCPHCKTQLKVGRASEAGNVFDLGQKFAKDFELTYQNKEGQKKHPIMGCYGIGITRAMGIIVEKNHDERGIIWPKSVAPFVTQLINIESLENAQKTYDALLENNIETLWDDRDESPGVKFKDADLIGCPVRLVVSAKTGDKIEWKQRNSEKIELLDLAEVIAKLK